MTRPTRIARTLALWAATGALLWQGPHSDVDAEVALARTAWAGWAARPFTVRVELLRRFANTVRARADTFAPCSTSIRTLAMSPAAHMSAVDPYALAPFTSAPASMSTPMVSSDE